MFVTTITEVHLLTQVETIAIVNFMLQWSVRRTNCHLGIQFRWIAISSLSNSPQFSVPSSKYSLILFLIRYCLSPYVYKIASGGTKPYKETTETNGEGIIMSDDSTELPLQAKDPCVGSRLMHSAFRIIQLLTKRQWVNYSEIDKYNCIKTHFL